ncbi:MAG: hypothetical protein A2Z12_05445 [Actinobacteria bacterium RBG_16_68_21]|nr:MAG: hypothetical protein A2Z12_05445 [Actinobacteria bacterium RBG_16_68_21]
MTDQTPRQTLEDDPAGDRPLRRRSRRWPLGALTLIAAIVVGVGILVFGGSDDSPTPTSIPALGGFEVPTGDAAPDFIIDLLDGTRFVLADELAAGRPVILNLWASWCTPCREEMPELDAAAAANPAVSFIGIAVDDDPTAAEEFAADIGVSYPLAIDEPGSVARKYPSPGLPTTFFISTDGRIVRVLYGGLTREQVSAAISEVFDL